MAMAWTLPKIFLEQVYPWVDCELFPVLDFMIFNGQVFRTPHGAYFHRLS